MTKSIDAKTLKGWLHDGGEIALFDVREHGQYGEGHPFHSVPLPYSRFELDLERLAPRRTVRMVLLDDGDGVAAKAAARAAALGYSDLHLLAGGAPAWAAAGFQLFAGVNVPSKTFGELVEHACDTPRITAQELVAMKERGDDFVIVDGRPWSEYRKMNIPGGICCPNGELALRVSEIAPDPATTIVVNCAGRTRSIIGAQALRHFGVANRVVALKDGTQGWFLSGLELERGADRRYPPAPADKAALRAKAGRLIERFGLSVIDAAAADRMLSDAARSTFLLDVRTEEEFAAGHLDGSAHAPGGQLVQSTDQWVGVRGARVILADDDGVRAPVIAMWLHQLGLEVHVLREGVAAKLAWRPAVARGRACLPVLTAIAPAAAADPATGALLIDVRPSMTYRSGHPRGAAWGIRSKLAPLLAGASGRPVVLIADDPDVARLAAVELGAGDPAAAGGRPIALLDGGFAAWKAAGLPVENTPDMPADAECIDFLFFVHDRHEGNREAAMQYLAWETHLIEQLDAQELAGFRVSAG